MEVHPGKLLNPGLHLDLKGFRLTVDQEGDGFVWWVRFRFGRGEWFRGMGTGRSPTQCFDAAMAYLAECVRNADVEAE